MGLGVVVMILAYFDLCPYYLSKALEWCLFVIDKIIHTIASFEQFIIKDIPFNSVFLLGSYMLIISSILWFEKRRFQRLIAIVVSVIFIQTALLWNKYDIANQREWIVFNSKRSTLITERNGKDVTLYANDSLIQIGTNNYTLNNYLMGNFSHLAAAKKIKNTAFFKGYTILILDSTGIYPKQQQADILVLTQSPKVNLERLIQSLHPKTIVADASNFKYLQKMWSTTCLKTKIPFHSTSEKGFYILN
jgi:competence protein ComEC